MDGDGDLDIALRTINGVRLLENRLTPPFDPDPGSCASRAGRVLGATCFTGLGRVEAAAILSGLEPAAQEPATLVPRAPVSIEVRWPDGTTRSPRPGGVVEIVRAPEALVEPSARPAAGAGPAAASAGCCVEGQP